MDRKEVGYDMKKYITLSLCTLLFTAALNVSVGSAQHTGPTENSWDHPWTKKSKQETITVTEGAARLVVNNEDISAQAEGGVYMGNEESGFYPLTLTYKGTTYVPLRIISEKLGKEVSWFAEDKIVYIAGFGNPRGQDKTFNPWPQDMAYQSKITVTRDFARLVIDQIDVSSEYESGFFTNGKETVPIAFNYEGTTYVPLRIITDYSTSDVKWDAKNRIVNISSGF